MYQYTIIMIILYKNNEFKLNLFFTRGIIYLFIIKKKNILPN